MISLWRRFSSSPSHLWAYTRDANWHSAPWLSGIIQRENKCTPRAGALGKGIWQLSCRGLRVALWKQWHALGEPQEGTPGWVLTVPPGPATSPLLSPEDRGDGRCCQGAVQKKEIVASQCWLAIAASSTSNLKSAWNFSVEVIGVACRNSFHGSVGEHREMTGQCKSWASVFLLQTNFSLNGHKTVMYGLISDNLNTKHLSKVPHGGVAFLYCKKRATPIPTFSSLLLGEGAGPAGHKSSPAGRGAVRLAGGQRCGMGSNGRLRWGRSSSKLQSSGRGCSVAGLDRRWRRSVGAAVAEHFKVELLCGSCI